MIVEGSSLWIAIKEIRELNVERQPIYRFLKESRHSEILIIFTEDFCAVIGLMIALIGTVLTMITGNAFFDAFSGLLIGLLLMVAAIFLAREFYSLLIGESVTKRDLAVIKQAFERPDVDRLIDVKTVHLGPAEILIAAKVGIAAKQEEVGYEIVNEIEAEIRHQMADKKVYIYIETDEYDPHYMEKRRKLVRPSH